jgi:hypothetical protein
MQAEGELSGGEEWGKSAQDDKDKPEVICHQCQHNNSQRDVKPSFICKLR